MAKSSSATDTRAHPHPATRDTIALETGAITQHEAYPGDQYVMRLAAPRIARDALPGQFVHLRCDDALPMRRPMSIMRADAQAGWIDILYKAHGLGTHCLSRREVGESISLLGPIGVPFKLEAYRKHALLIGGGVGIPPMVCLAEHMRRTKAKVSPLVLMGSEIPFPFTARPSRLLVDAMPAGVIAAMPLLDDWGMPSRLASRQGYAGCFDGLVTELAHAWLTESGADVRRQVEIFACGPTPMLRAVAALAREFDLPCELSLEEYMACAVGGCAGCAVAVHTEDGIAMKRVCVDGPVFEAQSVFPA